MPARQKKKRELLQDDLWCRRALGDDAMSFDETRHYLWILDEELQQHVYDRTIVCLEDKRAGAPPGLRFPRWQFHRDRIIEGVGAVLRALRYTSDPLQQALWFLRKNRRLGGEVPLHLLEMGEIGLVLKAASTEHGEAHG